MSSKKIIVCLCVAAGAALFAYIVYRYWFCAPDETMKTVVGLVNKNSFPTVQLTPIKFLGRDYNTTLTGPTISVRGIFVDPPQPLYDNQLPSLRVNPQLIYNVIRNDKIKSNLTNPFDFIGYNIEVVVVGTLSADGRYIVAEYIDVPSVSEHVTPPSHNRLVK